jgi:hypothetical protein
MPTVTSRSIMLVVSMAVAATSAAQAPAPVAPAPASVPARTVSDGPPSAQDPRVCLEFPDRAQVIACAEKYRPRRQAAKT